MSNDEFGKKKKVLLFEKKLLIFELEKLFWGQNFEWLRVQKLIILYQILYLYLYLLLLAFILQKWLVEKDAMLIRLPYASSTVVLPTTILLPNALPTAILTNVILPMTIRPLPVLLIIANLT